MPRYERILPLWGVVVMGLGLILLVERINTLTFVVHLPNGAIASISIAWLILFFLLILAVVGSEALQREADYANLEDRPSGWRQPLHLDAWIMPLLITLTTFLFLRLLDSMVARSVGRALAGLFLLVALVAQHYGRDERPRIRSLGRQAIAVLVYLNAFFLYGAIYAPKLRSLFSATAIVLLSFMLAFVLLRRFAPPGRSSLLYAAVVGLCVGEVTWPLNYWVIEGMIGGIFLLVVFYTLSNLARHHLQEKLTLRTALEYIVVGLFGVGLIGLYAFWFRPA